MKTQNRKASLLSTCYAAASLSLALVLPFFTGQIPKIGGMLCPMHFPVLLCGAIAGPGYGALVGFVAPLLRSLLFGAPPLFPTAVGMAFELCAYGFSMGLFVRLLPKNPGGTVGALLVSQIVGKFVGGVAKFVFFFCGWIPEYSVGVFLAAYFVDSLPGIVLQFLLIPIVVSALRRAKLLRDGQ